MAQLYSFKNKLPTEGNRKQLVEESFGKGMQFTNSPLTEGYAKVLVNLDIKNNGEILTPRPGLRTTQAFGYDTDTDCTGAEQIFAAKEQYVNDVAHAQFLLLQTLAAGSTQLRQGSVISITGHPDSQGYSYGDTEVQRYSETTAATVNFVVPQNAEIHGIPLNTETPLARQVGTFAWNNNYYTLDPVNKKVLHTEWDTENGLFDFVRNDPKALTAKEAVMWGYNMLSTTPYTFTNVAAGAGSVIQFTGMLPYDANGALCLSPVVNQSLTFEVFYSVEVGKKYNIVWEWKPTTADVWTQLSAADVTFTSPLQDQKITFSPPEDKIILRVTAYGYTGDTKNSYADNVLAVGFSFDKSDYGSTANTSPTTYDLYSATGMTYWKGRLVMWGAPEDPSLLFTSDVNDPTYFPYPNGADTFDEPIRFAMEFMDKLLVYTSTKLHMLTLSTDGLSWTKTCIQNNLSINDWDIHLIQTVKNMVFFRSGNYYYMIVPKANSATGELTLAPVSKPMYYFFDDFETNVKAIISLVYGYNDDLVLQHYYNYLDFEDVHNVYVFETEKSELINFCLLYNIVDRSWRVYCIGSQNFLQPYKADATQRGTLCTMGTELWDATASALPQLLRFFPSNNADLFIPKDIAPTDDFDTAFEAVHYFRNWQHLDTGYHEHNSNFKRRYREIQFLINNISNKALKFYTEFMLDGEIRKDMYTSQVTQELDPTDPDYGQITIEKVLIDPLTAPSTTLLGEWELGVSMFPEVAFWKAREPVSGKGNTPRYFIICRDENMYELLNISWVFVDRYSR